MDTVVWTVVLMAAVGLVGSVLLLIVSRKLAIGEDERLTYLMSILPGVNCGACGHPGCEQYAKAMMNGAPPNACTTATASRRRWPRTWAWSPRAWCSAKRSWPAKARSTISTRSSCSRAFPAAACLARCLTAACRARSAASATATAPKRARSTP